MNNKLRFWALDLLKLHAFINILIWHYVSVMWAYSDEFFPFRDVNFIWHGIELFNRSFVHSGHTILMITAFLSGLLGGKIRKPSFYLFLLIGLVAFSLVEKRDPTEPMIEWDIYALVFVGFAFSFWIQKVSRFTLLVCAAMFFAFTWIPFWNYTLPPEWPAIVQQFLIGDCVNASGQWPLLPWVFFLWLFFIIGHLYRLEKGEKYLAFSWTPFIFYAVAFIGLFPWFGRMYVDPSNNSTHCLLVRTPPFEFYAYFVPILAAFHLSLMDRPNEWVRKHLAWLSRLEVTRSFWIVYFLQYVVINLMERTMGEQLRSNSWLCLIGLIVVWPVCEFLSRGLRTAYRDWRAKSST